MLKYGETVNVETNQLLVCYTDLVNKYGENSNEVKYFLDQYRDNKEFTRLASVTSDIRAAFADGTIE